VESVINTISIRVAKNIRKFLEMSKITSSEQIVFDSRQLPQCCCDLSATAALSSANINLRLLIATLHKLIFFQLFRYF